LSYRSQSPAILYSWPSVGKLLCYQIDEGNVEWTLDHFKSFLNDLIEYKVMPPSSLTVVAHSLGNRLIVWSGEELTKNPLLKQVVMISPDMDNETFKHYARRYQESKINGMLLLSFRDRALPISQMLHGGYYRMGESLDPFFSLVARPTDMLQSAVEVISDPLVRFFSAIPGAGGANVLHAEPIAEKDDDDASPFKIIDYTELDHGLIGHKIPWGLVANLCVGGKPAPGQSLVARTDINFNLLSRFMRWAFDMAPQTVSDKTAVLHVVTE
jgi:hypothetical protein